MQVSQLLGSGVTPKVLDLVLTEISNFANIYEGIAANLECDISATLINCSNNS